MRHVLLEELYEQPVLNSQKMSANTASFLKYYKTPPTLNQVETALANEFNPLSIPLDSSGDGKFRSLYLDYI